MLALSLYARNYAVHEGKLQLNGFCDSFTGVRGDRKQLSRYLWKP